MTAAGEPSVRDIMRRLLLWQSWKWLVAARHIDELIELEGDLENPITLMASVEHDLHPAVATLLACFGAGVDLPVDGR